MLRFFRSIRIDLISFLAGFATATLTWWLLNYLRPSLLKLWRRIRRSFQAARQGIQAGTEQRHRADTLKYVQGLHLAAALFSLDEILIPPRLYPPPPGIDPDQAPPYEDVASMLIPYMPDWPEMPSAFGAHTLDPLEALQNGVNLAIIGPPGSGKTTALVYIATQLARRENPYRENQQLPIFAHIADIVIPEENLKTPLDPLITAVMHRASALTQPRLAETIRTNFEFGTAILLIDGLDELAPQPLQQALAYLQNLIEAFPDTQIVVSTASQHLQKLPELGFAVMGMAAWGKNEQAKYIQRWGELWDEFISNRLDEENFVDPIFINSWLLKLEQAASPLEFTLKVWAAYAGDVRGPHIIDALEAYLLRMTVGIPKARPSLELFASQVLTTMTATLQEKDIRQWLQSTDEVAPTADLFENPSLAALEKPSENTIPRILPDLIDSKLMVERPNQRFGFAHPLMAAYLAGNALDKQGGDRIFSQPNWPMKEMSSYFFMAINNEVGYHIHQVLNTLEAPLFENILLAGRWLQSLPGGSQYRKPILQKLSVMVQSEDLPFSLRTKCVAALATSNDPGVATLFRHLLKAEQINTRHLAALGAGYLRDVEAIKDLQNMLIDYPIVGQAACLALVHIGTKPALEAAADILLSGDEQVRRAAAEAFACHPTQGHALLKEGSKVDDLLVRRATIYGLQKVREPWALEILEELQIEDAQWVVKDAAGQAVETLKQADAAIPVKLPPLEDIPWLIAYASEQNMGISADSAGEMLIQALRNGNEDQKLAAMWQIRQRGKGQIFPAIYHIYRDPHPELADAAYQTIWFIATCGIEIPPLHQFGLG